MKDMYTHISATETIVVREWSLADLEEFMRDALGVDEVHIDHHENGESLIVTLIKNSK